MGMGNALNDVISNSILNSLKDLQKDSSCRVVVLAGRGAAFCAGGDLSRMERASKMAKAKSKTEAGRFAALLYRMHIFPKPLIARVHGVAAAAGCQLVSMCDLAVAVPEAKFALSGIHNGLFCSTPAVGVARNINRKRAMEMLVTGDLINAETARAWGLVNRVVPFDALDAEIAKLTDAIKAKSGAAIALGKDAFYQQIDMGLIDAYELAGRTMTCNLQDADGIEGVDAFVGKRKAAWKINRS